MAYVETLYLVSILENRWYGAISSLYNDCIIKKTPFQKADGMVTICKSIVIASLVNAIPNNDKIDLFANIS